MQAFACHPVSSIHIPLRSAVCPVPHTTELFSVGSRWETMKPANRVHPIFTRSHVNVTPLTPNTLQTASLSSLFLCFFFFFFPFLGSCCFHCFLLCPLWRFLISTQPSPLGGFQSLPLTLSLRLSLSLDNLTCISWTTLVWSPLALSLIFIHLYADILPLCTVTCLTGY